MATGLRGGSRRKTIGPYELVSALHQSYLGPLWIARSADAGDAGLLVARRIAEPADDEAGTTAALAQAAEWACSLDHEGLVPVIGHASDEEELVVASRYVEGEPLRSVQRLAGITRSPMPAPVALRVASDLLETLSHLHELRYQDEPLLAAPNPDGVLLCTDGHARLLEAPVGAVACRLGDWARDPKRAAYDAPELAGEASTVDQRADVFTLGVMLWEMLRNRPLFAGASFEAVAKRVQTASIRRVDSLKPAGGEPIAASVADIVERVLVRDPSERYESATDMLAAILGETLASHEEVAAFVEQLATDVLGKQRRKVAEAAGAAASGPGGAEELSPEPPAGPPGKPPRKKKPMRKQTLLGMTAPLQPGKGIPPAADSMDPIILSPVAADDADAAGPAADEDETVALEAAGGDEDETVALEAAGGDEDETAALEAVAPAADAEPGDAESEADALASAPGPGDRISDEVAAGLAASIAESLGDGVESVAAASAAKKPGSLGYDMLSIADDPSVEDDLPTAAKAALDAERAQAHRKRLVMIVGGVMAIAAAVIVATVIGGGANGDTAEQPQGSVTPADTAAPSGQGSAAASAPASATGSATVAPVAEDAGAEPDAAAVASAPPSAQPSASAVARPQPARHWPPPQHRPAPKPKPPQKYVPGGI